jgi:hypothetical protein
MLSPRPGLGYTASVDSDRDGYTMGEAARRRPVAVRMFALLYAVGLAGLLVGLSVAPSTQPGDTFHATPKAVVGAAVAIDHIGDQDLGFGDAAQTYLPYLTAAPLLAGLVRIVAVFAAVMRRPVDLVSWYRCGLHGRAPPTSW